MSISKIIRAMNAYHAQITEHKTVFIEKVGDNPDMNDPQTVRRYEVALADRKLNDTFSRNDLRTKYTSAIADMKKQNHSRVLDAPTTDQVNTLNVLRMIENPDDQLMAYAAKTLKGNTLSMYALNAIAKKAKKAQADIFLPMPEAETDSALDALNAYCDNFAQMPAEEFLASYDPIDANAVEDFVTSILHVPAKPFLAAVDY